MSDRIGDFLGSYLPAPTVKDDRENMERLRLELNRLQTVIGVTVPATDYILITDEKAQNTAGGTFTSGAWRTRDLNTEKVDIGNHASVASNQITLAAGTYRCRAACPASEVGRHAARLQNITDGTTIATGSSAYGAAGAGSVSFVVARFTITAQKVIEVQHQCAITVSTNGLGVESNFQVETYTMVELIRE